MTLPSYVIAKEIRHNHWKIQKMNSRIEWNSEIDNWKCVIYVRVVNKLDVKAIAVFTIIIDEMINAWFIMLISQWATAQIIFSTMLNNSKLIIREKIGNRLHYTEIFAYMHWTLYIVDNV